VAKAVFRPSVTPDSLGPWKEPIRELITREFPGSKPKFLAFPKGRPALVVLWKGFRGHSNAARLEMVRSALGADDSGRFSIIMAWMPEEAEEMDDRFYE
jgi:hypothetical protein